MTAEAPTRHILPLVMAGMFAANAPAPTQQLPHTRPVEVLDPVKIKRGVQVYAAQRCASCHSIDGQGNRRYPLDGVGSRLDRETVRTWIVEPQKARPGVRKRGLTQLSAEDLDGLVSYILSLKARP
jgi:mono/diheme cytochrome c family protein